MQRRQEWLEAAEDAEVDDPRVEVRRAGFSKFGLDLDEFKLKTGRKPRGWKKCVNIASWVCIDEMRVLLEIHYDDVHYKRWKDKEGRAPPRRGEYKVINSVANSHRKRLYPRLALPVTVKALLQAPADEDNVLVPDPAPQLWQNVPRVPFAKL